MSKKIFNTIWIVAFAVFIASLFLVLGISYSHFTEAQKTRLKNDVMIAARGVEIAGEDFFTNLVLSGDRITWIDADGTVLYDSEADVDSLENHLEREEIIAAFETGYGESERKSDTLGTTQLYSAARLSDGTVLRLSMEHMGVWSLLLSLSKPIVLVILVVLGLSIVLASQLAKKIVEPINDIDPERPEDYLGNERYKEIEPLLRSLAKYKELLKIDKEQIENASLIRQEFTANVSHELKTPLHSISGYAELLENGMVKSEDIKPFAGKIRSESVRMTNLVEDIIDLTRLDSGGVDMNREDCDLSRIAENAVDSLRPVAELKDIEMRLDLEPAPINGVPEYLYSIIYNLCDNGIKYNHDGGYVSVTIKNRDEGICLWVKDDGIGIPKEYQGRIFERFYRVDKSRSKNVGGTGLGLSIVKHAALIHKAKIFIKSAPGKGSEFTVVFPKDVKNMRGSN